MSDLVIVESPAKAKTIKKYLGGDYEVIASMGHVRDLPKSKLSVDIENNFEPHYINIRGKSDVINDLKKRYKSATKTYLATDADTHHVAHNHIALCNLRVIARANYLHRLIVAHLIKHAKLLVGLCLEIEGEPCGKEDSHKDAYWLEEHLCALVQSVVLVDGNGN